MKNKINVIRENYQKNRNLYLFGLLAVFLFLAIIVMVKLDLGTKVLRYRSYRSNQDETQFVHDFVSGTEISQSFRNYRDFDFITLSFSDHDMRLPGKMILQIIDPETDAVLYDEEKAMSDIHYNVPVEISFENFGGGMAGKEYELRLLALETGEEALGVFGYQTEEEHAVLNGQETEYALSLGIHSYTDLYRNMTILLLGIEMIVVLLVILGAFQFHLKEQQMFLIIALPFAMCMLILWPGNSVYDEIRHYHTVYHYSNVLLGCGSEDTHTEIQMRKEDISDSDELEQLGTAVNYQTQRFWYSVDRIWTSEGDTSTIAVDISDATVVSDGKVVQYLPGVLGMSLARLLGCNYFWMMTITRMAIMGFYFGMCYYAIKRIPVLKLMVVLVSALPMNLYQASGISYDSFTYAVGIVVFAFVIKLWHEGLKRSDWIKFAIAVTVLGNCKGGVYLTLIFLMCLIPKEKYAGKKWLKFGGILLVAGMSMVIAFLPTLISWFVVMPQQANVSEVINSGGVIAQKLSPFLVLDEPVRYVTMLIQTTLTNLDTYLGQMLGYRTAWASASISLVVMMPFLVLLILSAIGAEKEQFQISAIARWGIGGILLLEYLGMQAIFLGETPVYSDIILGFQGRYFILFLPCILLLFRNQGLVYKRNKEYLYVWFSMAQVVYMYFFIELFMCA